MSGAECKDGELEGLRKEESWGGSIISGHMPETSRGRGEVG